MFCPISNQRLLIERDGYIECFRKAFVPIHPPGVLSALAPEAYVGPVDPATLPKHDAELTAEEKRIKDARARVPPPEAALNLRDIEVGYDNPV